MAESFLEKMRRLASKKSGGELVSPALTSIILAKADPSSASDAVKVACALYGKPVVRATAVAFIEALLED